MRYRDFSIITLFWLCSALGGALATPASPIPNTVAVVAGPERIMEYLRLIDAESGMSFDFSWVPIGRASTVVVFLKNSDDISSVPSQYLSVFKEALNLGEARHYTVPVGAGINNTKQELHFVMMDQYAFLFEQQINIDPDMFNPSYVFSCILASNIISETAASSSSEDLVMHAARCGRWF